MEGEAASVDGCWTGASFEPDLKGFVLFVDGIDSVVGADKDAAWVKTDGDIVSESARIGLPCCCRAELGLIEWCTCKKRFALL